ncbi:MAG: hypothetical protein N3B18_11485, partial [Desulfobacterota bacterium]|nr:hypothetical protein [Thermodesulfobacteriota bacterium]
MNERPYDLVGKAGIALILLAAVDKMLAVFREILIASRFGVSSQLDMFNLAWAVPGILSLFFSGALTGAFIPLYVQWLQTRHIEDVHNICRLLIWGAV